MDIQNELLNESMSYLENLDTINEDAKETFEKAKVVLIRLIEKLIILIKKAANNLRVISSNIKTKIQGGQTTLDITGIDFGGKSFHADDLLVIQQAVKELVRVAASPTSSAVQNATQLDDKIVNVYRKQLFVKKDTTFQINKIDKYAMILEQIAHDVESVKNYCSKTLSVTINRTISTNANKGTEQHQVDEKEIDSKDAKQMIRQQITNFYNPVISDFTSMLRQVSSYIEEKTTHANSKERQNFKVNEKAAKTLQKRQENSIKQVQNQVKNNPNMKIQRYTQTTYK